MPIATQVTPHKTLSPHSVEPVDQEKNALRGPRIMLMGGPSSGKTHSLRTFLDLGLEVFIIATEYPDVLLDTPPEKMHWAYVEPGLADWDTLKSNAEKINALSNDALQKLPGVNKQKYRQFFDVLNVLSNFKCERTGQVFGNAAEWGLNRVLVIDSLSGLSIMARDLAVGAKPIISQPDWGVMMHNLEMFLNACVTGTRCTFVLTAHLERELDEVSGGMRLMASTLGRKLAPKLPRFFSDVVLCKRDGRSWSWDTSVSDVDVKARNLPIGVGGIPQNFKQIVDAWEKRTGEKLG